MARAKNNNLKKPNEEMEYTHYQVQELKRCAQDPIYFIKTYVKIQHPIRGSIPFELYEYQENMITGFLENRHIVVLSARQTGKSTTSAMYLLWYAMFNFDKTILIAANKNKNAIEMIMRIRYAYENLPMWIKPGVKDDGWNKHEIGFDNDSRIVSTATSEDSGRGMSISLLFLDEFAFVKSSIQDEFWTAIEPTLSTGGACIMTSTPNGDMNIYAQIWRGAELGANGFIPIKIDWDQPPGRDEQFKEEAIGRIGQRKWNQEYECEFLSSDALLIDSLYLSNITPAISKIKPVTTVNEVILFEHIVPAMTYLIGVDPATGNGEDFSVITIYNFPQLKQVGQYRSNTMTTNDLYNTLKNILSHIDKANASAYFSIENNGVGQGLIALLEADETPPNSAQFVSEDGKNKRGMTTTASNKMRACVNFKNMFERGDIIVQSNILLSELKSYIRSKGAYAAQVGATDDCIAATLIVIRLVEEIATYEQAAFDKLYSTDDQLWDESVWENTDDDSDETYDPIVF